MPGLYLSPFADCYRCPLKLRHPSCGLACAEHLRQVIKLQSQHQVAAIIAEPIQGTAGTSFRPPSFCRRLSRLRGSSELSLFLTKCKPALAGRERCGGSSTTGFRLTS